MEETTIGELVLLLSADAAAFERDHAAPALLFSSGWKRGRAAAADDPTHRGAALAQILSRTSVIDPKAPVLPTDLQVTKVDDEAAPPASGDATGPVILAGSSCVAFLRKSSRNPFAHMITIGRAQNNDVILQDGAVSKFHAYVVAKPGGALTLTDQNSTNGTFLDEQKLVPDRAATLADAAVVRFGPSLRAVFYTAAGLRRYLEQFRRRAL